MTASFQKTNHTHKRLKYERFLFGQDKTGGVQFSIKMPLADRLNHNKKTVTICELI